MIQFIVSMITELSEKVKGNAEFSGKKTPQPIVELLQPLHDHLGAHHQRKAQNFCHKQNCGLIPSLLDHGIDSVC